ncbi:predicted protein [Streptomyces sp. C]|nr:predicted protein [Streptomyces sp. C]
MLRPCGPSSADEKIEPSGRRREGYMTTATHEQATHPLDPDNPWSRAQTTSSPSAELLDRAHAGWERFLVTFEGAPDE